MEEHPHASPPPHPLSGCLEFFSPWSLDPLTFPVSEEAVYSQKVIHSPIRSTSLLKRILTSCPGGGKGQDSSTQSPINSLIERHSKEHCPTARVLKMGKLRHQGRKSWGVRVRAEPQSSPPKIHRPSIILHPIQAPPKFHELSFDFEFQHPS